MKQTRRTFFKQGLMGALLLSGVTTLKADPVKPKAAKAVNPFKLGMAGYTFVNFDLETTLKTLERLDIHYLCIKDFFNFIYLHKIVLPTSVRLFFYYTSKKFLLQ